MSLIFVTEYLASERVLKVKHECDGRDEILPLDVIGATLALADLYERTDLTTAAEDKADAEAFFGRPPGGLTA